MVYEEVAHLSGNYIDVAEFVSLWLTGGNISVVARPVIKVENFLGRWFSRSH
ncbi:hypothetical protein [Halobacillus sp. HZG1]|uniref:hypothetical protein n=1 Tax=Halobacillus sp. HZG1 TaxID=3111769 RepID=UPI002DB66CDE|nr:hypothetical protein [Halobacillus sp. HZG1]